MRHRFLGVALLALPMLLSAQQPMQSTANPITQSYKAYHTRNSGWLMAAFDSIPASMYSFRPTPAQQSIGYIAQHLESANYQLCSLFGGTPYAMTSRDSLADTVKAMWPKDTLVARLKASFAYCDGALSRVDDSKLAENVAVGPPSAGRTAPRARLLLTYVTDLVDHYSQLAVYMRLNGMLPPSAQPRPRS